MSSNPFENISKIEAELWAAADNLRANSKLTANEYCMPVLGVIFLKHASNRYNQALEEIEANQAVGRMPQRALTSADFKRRRALMLPEAARYESLLALPSGSELGNALVEAMRSIEAEFEPLQGQLPKDYSSLEDSLLENLLRTFDSEVLRTASGDVFGRINEYFLMKFAIQGAQDNGEFFTPPSLVQTIVNVIEPDHGIVMDPACGSGGMFVQSSHFLEDKKEDPAHLFTFYGHEFKTSNLRLAKMNLAVHGLEGNLLEANTFYDDPHELLGKCDFVMANPPFNVDSVDAGKVQNDPRLPFGLPGVNNKNEVSNGNYLWISYFHSYLNENGRAGFVMSSQASSSGGVDAEVRQRLVETGDVDVMISIRSNFFYTRTVPCELWHFDKGKPEERRDQVLMLDARNIFRKVTRKIYDFTPEHLANLSAIVWLYRGQNERFTSLVQKHLDTTLDEADRISEQAEDAKEGYEAYVRAASAFMNSLPQDSPLQLMLRERDDAAKSCFESLEELVRRIDNEWQSSCEENTAAQAQLLEELEELSKGCRELVKAVDLTFKLASRVVDYAEKEANARKHEAWNRPAINKLGKAFDELRKALNDQLKVTAYFERQAHWLLSRFPNAELVDVPGLVKLTSLSEIEDNDWSLTPGRYVGVAPEEEDEGFDFGETILNLHIELAELNEKAAVLAATIQKNFEELGV